MAGAWLANDVAQFKTLTVDQTVDAINIWKATNGEEIHGFLWQTVPPRPSLLPT